MSRPKLPEEEKRSEKLVLSFRKEQMVKMRLLAAYDNMDVKVWAERLILETIGQEDTDKHAIPKEGP